MSETFTAYAECPRCQFIDCHLMRNPHPAPSREVMAHWEATREEIVVHRWGVGEVMRRFNPAPPRDESGFDVIRQCKCGFEWGQK